VTPEVLGIIERLFKAAILVPTLGLVSWWIFTNWLDRTVTLQEAVIGYCLVGAAFLLGVISIIRGGWGFIGILALIYAAILALAVWEYVYWRRRERDHCQSEVARYRSAIEKDPMNAAAYSFLGENLLKLSRFEEARAELEKALELDPQSARDRRLLREAEERRARIPWRRTD
jgi:tetratricopeptide (TPR) repeat protein